MGHTISGQRCAILCSLGVGVVLPCPNRVANTEQREESRYAKGTAHAPSLEG